MACGSCGTGGCSTKNKSKGTDGEASVAGCGSGGCSSGSCNKMNSFDWLSDIDLPSVGFKYDIVELRFKGGRKDYFRNPNGLELYTGDAVVVDAGSGYHIGNVSLQGELVKLNMKKRGLKEDSTEMLSIYRVATDKDLSKFQEAANRELSTLFRTRQIIDQLKLDMKLADVEFQADNTKATFFYSAEERVDFRELIKLLAGEFKIRVDMRQISLRQEAARLGGIGSCGRELCCSTWLVDFKSVATSAARYQNLSLNPTKLSGQCSRLKCCLNFELDTYMDALKDIPNIDKPILLENEELYLQKTDIFRRVMWFGSRGDANNWRPASVDRIKWIIEENKQGRKVSALTEEIEAEIKSVLEEKASANSELLELDKKFSDKERGRKEENRRKQKEAEDAKRRQKEARAQQGGVAQGAEVQPQGKNQPQGQNRNQKQGGRPDNRQGGQRPDNQRSENKPNAQAKSQQNREQRGNQQNIKPENKGSQGNNAAGNALGNAQGGGNKGNKQGQKPQQRQQPRPQTPKQDDKPGRELELSDFTSLYNESSEPDTTAGTNQQKKHRPKFNKFRNKNKDNKGGQTPPPQA